MAWLGTIRVSPVPSGMTVPSANSRSSAWAENHRSEPEGILPSATNQSYAVSGQTGYHSRSPQPGSDY